MIGNIKFSFSDKPNVECEFFMHSFQVPSQLQLQYLWLLLCRPRLQSQAPRSMEVTVSVKPRQILQQH